MLFDCCDGAHALVALLATRDLFKPLHLRCVSEAHLRHGECALQCAAPRLQISARDELATGAMREGGEVLMLGAVRNGADGARTFCRMIMLSTWAR
jgi:hypothetical protein